MKLVYTKTNRKPSNVKKGAEVVVGDRVRMREGWATVTFFRPPHKPSSEGKVCIKLDGAEFENEYYVSVIGAEWIEREDRDNG